MSTKKSKSKNQVQDWHEIWQELTDTNDRAAAIVGDAILDDALSRLLSAYFVANQKEVNGLLERPGPLWNFYAKSSIAYCLGLITQGQLRDLRAVNRIRNHFAHGLRSASFGDEAIIKDMSRFEKYKGLLARDTDSPRQQFNVAVSALAYSFVVKTATTQHCKEIKDKSLGELMKELASSSSAESPAG